MVKKITAPKKDLRDKRLKLKSLHRDVSQTRSELENLPPGQLPPASSSNAARQVRSRLNNTFPVDWQSLHLSIADRKNEKEDTGPAE